VALLLKIHSLGGFSHADELLALCIGCTSDNLPSLGAQIKAFGFNIINLLE